MRRFEPRPDASRLERERLDDAALDRSIDAALGERPAGAPLWIFAYGSLMWSPTFAHDAKRVGAVFGYHRSFCLWSRINRGTPERPGLVLTLERGGSCRGLAWRVPRGIAREELRDLWRREMTFGSYHPRWLACHAGADTFPVLAFVVNRACSGYAGKLPVEAMVNAIATARGKFGSSAEYLFRTQETLHHHGIHDARVKRLADLVRAHLAAGGSAPRAAA